MGIEGYMGLEGRWGKCLDDYVQTRDIADVATAQAVAGSGGVKAGELARTRALRVGVLTRTAQGELRDVQVRGRLP